MGDRLIQTNLSATHLAEDRAKIAREIIDMLTELHKSSALIVCDQEPYAEKLPSEMLTGDSKMSYHMDGWEWRAEDILEDLRLERLQKENGLCRSIKERYHQFHGVNTEAMHELKHRLEKAEYPSDGVDAVVQKSPYYGVYALLQHERRRRIRSERERGLIPPHEPTFCTAIVTYVLDDGRVGFPVEWLNYEQSLPFEHFLDDLTSIHAVFTTRREAEDDTAAEYRNLVRAECWWYAEFSKRDFDDAINSFTEGEDATYHIGPSWGKSVWKKLRWEEEYKALRARLLRLGEDAFCLIMPVGVRVRKGMFPAYTRQNKLYVDASQRHAQAVEDKRKFEESWSGSEGHLTNSYTYKIPDFENETERQQFEDGVDALIARRQVDNSRPDARTSLQAKIPEPEPEVEDEETTADRELKAKADAEKALGTENYKKRKFDVAFSSARVA